MYRTAENDTERSRLEAELYRPPAGHQRSVSRVRRGLDMAAAQRMAADVEAWDREAAGV